MVWFQAAAKIKHPQSCPGERWIYVAYVYIDKDPWQNNSAASLRSLEILIYEAGPGDGD